MSGQVHYYMKSRFAGSCTKCSKKYQKGSPVLWDSTTKKTTCLSCASKQFGIPYNTLLEKANIRGKKKKKDSSKAPAAARGRSAPRRRRAAI